MENCLSLFEEQKMNVVDYLQKRGIIDAMTHEDLSQHFDSPRRVYAGFDPTADGLHLGNFAIIMRLCQFQRMGHTPVVLLGGATALVGDPSGKSLERPLLDLHQVKENLKGIKAELSRFIDPENAIFINNYDWFESVSFITFLRDVAKNFRVGPMLAKESVKVRLQSNEGMSFTEFSYQLLQAYDFLQLYDHYGVCTQIGGSDQWGNITAGTELIRKQRAKSAYGITFPLLSRSDGKKFGKSEEGTIWLSKDKLSPYHFYQYLLRVPDKDVGQLLRFLTFLELEEIIQLENDCKSGKLHPSDLQKKLASEVCRIVHGNAGLEEALEATKGLYPASAENLDCKALEEMEIPKHQFERSDIIGKKIIEVAVIAKLFASKGEARRMIRNGGVYFNNNRLEDEELVVEAENLLQDQYLLLAAGKRKKVLVKLA